MHRSESTRCANSYREQTQQREPKLLDHLVGALLEMHGHIEAECLSSLEVDHQLELDPDLDWKLARLRAPQYAVGIDRRTRIIIELVISVGRFRAQPNIRALMRNLAASRQVFAP
jgi:hypothetical protein